MFISFNQELATNVLRLLKHSTHKKGKYIRGHSTENALQLFSLISTSERIRHENALALAYIEFYKLKHGRNSLNNMFDGSNPALVFVKENGAVAIRALGNIPQRLDDLGGIYDAKPVEYKVRFTREQWLIKRLNKIELMRGVYYKDGGLAYPHYIQQVALGQFLPPNLQEHPVGFAPALVDTEGLACLFRSVLAAETPARLQEFAAMSGVNVRQEARNRIVASLGGNDAVHATRTAQLLLEDLRMYVTDFENAREQLGGVLDAFNGSNYQGGNPLIFGQENMDTVLDDVLLNVDTAVLAAIPEIRAFLTHYVEQSIQTREIMEGREMIAVLSHVTGQRIRVYAANPNEPWEDTDPQSNQVGIQLHYTRFAGVGRRNHFNPLLPVIAQQPPVQNQQQQQLGGQGGGGQQGHAQQQQPLQQGQLPQNQQQQAQHQNQPPQNNQGGQSNQQQVSQEVAGDDSVLKTLTETLSSWRGWVRKQDWSGILKSAFLLQRSKGTF